MLQDHEFLFYLKTSMNILQPTLIEMHLKQHSRRLGKLGVASAIMWVMSGGNHLEVGNR